MYSSDHTEVSRTKAMIDTIIKRMIITARTYLRNCSIVAAGQNIPVVDYQQLEYLSTKYNS